MAKNMFYYSGLPSGQDFSGCDICPFTLFENGKWSCTETESDITDLVNSGKRDRNCPFSTKDIG